MLARVLSAKIDPTENRVASSSKLLIMIRRRNRMSHWTMWLKSRATLTKVVDLGGGLCHVRQIRHVSTLCLIRRSAPLGAPASLRVSVSLAAAACQHENAPEAPHQILACGGCQTRGDPSIGRSAAKCVSPGQGHRRHLPSLSCMAKAAAYVHDHD